MWAVWVVWVPVCVAARECVADVASDRLNDSTGQRQYRLGSINKSDSNMRSFKFRINCDPSPSFPAPRWDVPLVAAGGSTFPT